MSGVMEGMRPKGSSNAEAKCGESITWALRLGGRAGEGEGEDNGESERARGRRRRGFAMGERGLGDGGREGVDDD